MADKKYPKQRNYIVKDMIDRHQKSGYHVDKAYEAEKYKCRSEITEEELEDIDGYSFQEFDS